MTLETVTISDANGDPVDVLGEAIPGEGFVQGSKLLFGGEDEARRVSDADGLPVRVLEMPAEALGVGAAADAPAPADTGTFSLVSGIKRLLARFTELLQTIKATGTPFTNGDWGVLLLAKRRDNDTSSVSNDGDYTTLNIDERGRLKVAAQPAGYAVVSSPLAGVNAQVALDVSRVSNVMLQMVVPSAVSGHNCTFEGSLNSTDGSNGNWFVLQAVRSNAATVETATGALAATPVYGWECSVNGLNWFRVRATAHASGSATWYVQAAPYATEPIPAAQVSPTQPVSGTVAVSAGTARVGFVAGSGIWWDDSSTVLAAGATFTGTSRDLIAVATATAFNSASTYAREIRVSAESDQSGTLWLEVSRDGTNWRRIKSVATAAVTGGGQYAEIVHAPSWRYARVGFTNGATLQTRFSIGSVAIAG